MLRNYRKPLIMATPKAGLRHPLAVSSLESMGPETSFSPILETIFTEPKEVKKVVFCSGFIYFKLMKLVESQHPNISIVRLEELAPFPMKQVQEVLSKYSKDTETLYVQDESMNMGALQYAKPYIERALKRVNYTNTEMDVIARPAHHSFTVGNATDYKAEEATLLSRIGDAIKI